MGASSNVRIEVDDSSGPVVGVRTPDGYDDAGWTAYLERMRGYPDRAQHYVTLTDARHSSTPNASQRARAAKLIQNEKERSLRWNVANALVHGSAFIRGAVTAIEWASPSPVPMKSFAHVADALDWLATLYEPRTGQPLPRPDRR